MLSKIFSMEEILKKFHDGQTIMFGDWHGEFAADDIIEGILDKGVKDITMQLLFLLVCQTLGLEN